VPGHSGATKGLTPTLNIGIAEPVGTTALPLRSGGCTTKTGTMPLTKPKPFAIFFPKLKY
jgi:hypothetical protein